FVGQAVKFCCAASGYPSPDSYECFFKSPSFIEEPEHEHEERPFRRDSWWQPGDDAQNCYIKVKIKSSSAAISFLAESGNALEKGTKFGTFKVKPRPNIEVNV
ncbi:unnamed protein product, partial [Owenia fusiformis]